MTIWPQKEREWGIRRWLNKKFGPGNKEHHAPENAPEPTPDVRLPFSMDKPGQGHSPAWADHHGHTPKEIKARRKRKARAKLQKASRKANRSK
jgi:hypothetical protein